MALHKTFYSTMFLLQEGKTKWKYKTFDLQSVESWEHVKEGVTKIFMKSGDLFLIKSDPQDFGDLMFTLADSHGMLLFDFSDN